jgi:hypothetical protein
MILYDKNGVPAFFKRSNGDLDTITPTGVINWMRERNISWKDVNQKNENYETIKM